MMPGVALLYGRQMAVLQVVLKWHGINTEGEFTSDTKNTWVRVRVRVFLLTS